MDGVEVAVIVWVIAIGLVAWWAARLGRGAIGWGVLAVLITPFLAAVALLMAGRRVKCPSCAEVVQPRAKICKHCGSVVGST